MSQITTYNPTEIRNHRIEAEAERTRRYEARHTPAEFIKLYCAWNIRPWPYIKNEEGNR